VGEATGVLLLGGMSRRFGSVKALAPLGPETLSERGWRALGEAFQRRIAIGKDADQLGLPFERIASGLAEFRGAERRFEIRGEPNGILVVDDYGHHPTEIAAVLAAARQLNRRVIVAFQPHRYSRTAALLDDFGPALAQADHVVLTDIYSAGEDPIPGATLDALVAAVRRHVKAPVDVAVRLDEVIPIVKRIAKPGDVVITLGAGSIGTLPDRLVEALR